MLIDPALPGAHCSPPLRRERRPWLQLVSAILKLAGDEAQLLSHAESPWASITFTGMRHTVRLRFTGDAGCDAAEAFIVAAPDHEFTLHGRLVADVSIDLVEHRQTPQPEVIVEATLLVLDDG